MHKQIIECNTGYRVQDGSCYGNREEAPNLNTKFKKKQPTVVFFCQTKTSSSNVNKIEDTQISVRAVLKTFLTSLVPINHEIYVHTISYANNPVEWLYKLRPGSYPPFPFFFFFAFGFFLRAFSGHRLNYHNDCKWLLGFRFI